jgi:endonuclease YncB( thermonuclease family)
MAKYTAICEYVQDGDTFRTAKQNWIRLARYDAPDEGEPYFNEAKRLLSSLILNKEIVYEQVGTSYGRIVAEVWQGDRNINDIMLQSGYKKK